MGFFKSKDKITVTTQVTRVFEDRNLPNSGRNGIIKSIVSGGGLTEHLLEELSNSLGVKADYAYKWAKDHDYMAGIPHSRTFAEADARTVVLQTIANEVGPITVLYNNFGPLNMLHWAFQHIIDLWDYNPDTNELVGLTPVKGGKVYLVDIVPVYMQETADWNIEIGNVGELENWGYSPKSGYAPSRPYTEVTGIGQYALQSPYEVDPDALFDCVKITYEWVNEAGVIVTETIRTDVQLDMFSDFVQVRYKKVADSKTGFFTYFYKSGLYPAIDGVFEMVYEDTGTYFPWTYVTYDGAVTEFANPALYKQGKQYVKYMGVDLDYISLAVGQNPDARDVEQVMLFFGLNPGSQEQEDIEYLFEYMLLLFNNSISQRTKAQQLQDYFGDYSNSVNQNIVIADRIFDMTFAYSGIKYERKTGKVAEVGFFTATYTTASNSSGQYPVSQPCYIYRKQVLSSVYDEVIVFNPQLTYQVVSKKGYVAGPGDNKLLFPIDRGVLNNLSLRKKELILGRSMHMCINTYSKVEGSFWGSTFFKAIMIVISIVILVWSAGTAWQAVAAAWAVGVAAVAIVLLQMLVTALVVNYAVKLFIKAVGPELGLIIAIVAMAVGAYGNSLNATWADTLLNISTSIAKESFKQDVLQSQAGIKDMATQLEGMQDQLDSLTAVRTDLGLDFKYNGVEGYDFIGYRPVTVFGEDPDSYFARTVHAGNIGVTTIDSVSGFFDARLTLPEMKDMINEENPYGLSIQ